MWDLSFTWNIPRLRLVRNRTALNHSNRTLMHNPCIGWVFDNRVLSRGVYLATLLNFNHLPLDITAPIEPTAYFRNNVVSLVVSKGCDLTRR